MLLSFVLLLYAIPRKSQALCRKFTSALSVCFAASSPRGGAFGRPGNFPLDAQGPIWRKRAGLATEGRRSFVQPLRRFAPAPLVGEPLAKPFTLRGMPKPLPLGEVAMRSIDGEGKPVSREPPYSDKLSLCQSDAIAASALLRQRPCPLSHLR